MYVPPSFAETDQGKLHEFIEQHSFATVVSLGAGVLVASHLPLLLERDSGAHGELIGHMARQNPQWRSLDGQPVLAIFHGPHAYISAAWYEAEQVVPTWNYVAVHAYGTFRLDDSPHRRAEIVQRYVQAYEAPLGLSWSLDTAGTAFTDKLLKAVVGFSISIDRLEGKWKLNQNQDAVRREKVVRALMDAGGEDQRKIAELILETLDD